MLLKINMIGDKFFIVDANIVLRWLLDDNKEQSKYAKTILSSGNAFLLTEVLAEVVYVLQGVYNINRKEIGNKLQKIINIFHCNDKNILKTALELFGTLNLDFVDCILLAYNHLHNIHIETFDKKLSSNLIGHK